MNDDVSKSSNNLVVDQRIKRKTIACFVLFGIAIVFAIIGWKWLNNQPEEQQALKPLRKVFNANERVFNNFFSNENLAKTYPVDSFSRLFVPGLPEIFS